MSLFRQMVIMLTLFLVIILVSVMWLNFKTSAQFVQNQLYTNAKNSAYSLGLSISKVSDPKDISTMETMINAIYDSGYYEQIILKDVDKKVVYVREDKVRLDDVPQWFISMVPIKNANATSNIMIGWSQFGTLGIRAHIGNAYRQLYLTFINLVQTFSMIGLVAFGVLYFLLTISLRALERIRHQATMIIENQFILEESVPFTTEFRSVTSAMNAMVCKVKDIFERENDTLQRYHELLYKDPQTKLYNRRYLLATLPDILSSTSGGYVLFSFSEMDRFKREAGYEKYSYLMELFSKSFTSIFADKTSTIITRLNDNDFFAVIPNSDIENIQVAIEVLIDEIKTVIEGMDKRVEIYFNLGCAVGEYWEHEDIKSLLSRADQVVTHAKTSGKFKLQKCLQQANSLVLGRDEWRNELMDSMRESRILLAMQKVGTYVDGEFQVIHEELFIRLKDKGGMIHSAGYFIPIATSLGLVDELDRYMIESVFKHIEDKTITQSVALNLSADFIKKYENIQWLRERLTIFHQYHKRVLWFEVSNIIALQEIEAVYALSVVIKSFGDKFGIDHFVMPERGAKYLQEIRPTYVKSNHIYLEDILGNKDSGESRESLINIITSLGIEMIVIGVEHSDQVDYLKKYGFKYFQGSFISPVALVE